MFKLIVVVFAAILALAVAAPKPGLITSPLVASAPLAYSAYPAPLTYSSGYSPYVAAPLAYGAAPLIHSASYARYSAPLVHY